MKNLIAKHAITTFRFSLLGLLLVLGFALTGAPGTATAETAKKHVNFDHLKTGFALDGVHARLKCEDCHLQGVFKGTPNKCSLCHSPGSHIATTSKPTNHIPTSLPCESCHKSAVSWSVSAVFSHADVRPGTCKSCHGVSASGKPSGHIATNESCDVCHRTTSWLPAGFNHTGVQPGACASCHGVTAKGKPSGHIPTNNSCDVCHRTTAWLPASYHDNVQALTGSCITCHGGSYPNHTAVKPSSHPVTSASCETCHTSFKTWVIASSGTFNHAGVLPGTCNSCHGVSAKGKSTDHIPTTASCDTCHKITGAFLDGRYHSNVQATPGSCITCHGGSYPKHTPMKPSTHPVTSASCDSCHSSFTTWVMSSGSFVHPTVQPGSCATCHGVTSKGKSTSHIPTTASCDACHKITGGFLDGRYHPNVTATPGACNTCHGVNPNVTSKSVDHIPATGSCDTCHKVNGGFLDGKYHANVQAAPGSCTTCHGGSYPKHTAVKPSSHPVTTASCETCHTSFVSWSVIVFNHTGVQPGTCQTCHGVTATGKPSSHFVTTKSCDACHNTSAWVPTIKYAHTSSAYRQHSAGVTCANCHKQNSEVIAWPFSAYKPDCAGCHADKYKPSAHEKAGGGTYTVLELKDCTGACHSPAGHHRPTSSSFN